MSNKAKGSRVERLIQLLNPIKKMSGRFINKNLFNSDKDLKNMKREIHIWDLPIEKIYVKLEDRFRGSLFKLAYEKYGSWNKLAKFFNIKRGDTLLARDWNMGLCCIPFSIILDIGQDVGLSKEEIEKNITEIKYKRKLNKRGGSSGKPIFNPKLPIKINEDFIEILGHICGDGNISRSNPKKGISFRYINSEKALIESFKDKVKKVFGNIEPNVQIRSGIGYRRENFCLQYPTIISLIVLSVFDCHSNDKKDLPNFIFELPEKAKCYFLRALFDDEGTVSVEEKRICIGLKPKKIVKKIRDLLTSLKFNPGRIFFSGNIHKINIDKRKDILLFRNLIGFKHPLKANKLNLIIKNGWKFNRYENGEVKDKILFFIKEKKKTNTEELIKLLRRHPSTIRMHLNNLENKNLINSRREKNNLLWSLNEQT